MRFRKDVLSFCIAVQAWCLDHGANCPIYTKDEIGTLAQNVNDLYSNRLSTIEHLEREKDAVRDMKQAKVDFLRAASHELKTPVTALNATLEKNFVLWYNSSCFEVRFIVYSTK